MPRFDLPLEELRTYRPTIAEPSDFDEFWRSTIAEARSFELPTTVERVDSPLSAFEIYDVTFPGFGGHPVRGWYILPAHAGGPLPTVVEYNGYGGGRGLPHERLAWPAAGYAYFLMDTRGQGSGWGTGGETADPVGTGASTPGFMTRGIENPEDYYYRRVYTDAVRAIDAVRQFERVDATRIAITGTSQGGGIALAVAALVEGLIGVMPNVPFLCHFERAIGMTGGFPYGEVVNYLAVHRNLVEQTFATLSYFDGATFASRSNAPALFSVALLDATCPPSTVFAAHNLYAGAAEMEVYPFNEHEGGEGEQWARQAAWLGRVLGARD